MHFPVESALVCKLMTLLVDVRQNASHEGDGDEEVNDETLERASVKINELNVELGKTVSDMKANPHLDIDLQQYPSLLRLIDSLAEYKDFLQQSSQTATFWLQHLYYIDVVKLFIGAERTGDWNLHVTALTRMINLFAATAHIHYAKVQDCISKICLI